MDKWFVRIIKFFLCLAIATPLVSKSGFLYPQNASASFLFQLTTAGAAILFLVLLSINSSHRPIWNALNLTVTAFFLIQIFLFFFSINPTRSLIGSADRMDGLWNLFHYYLFYIVAVSIFKTPDGIKFLSRFSLGVCGASSIIYLLSFFFSLFIPFGNPGVLANYIALHIPILFWQFSSSQSQKEKTYFIFLFLLYSTALLITGNRAAFLGWLVALVGFAFYYCLLQKRRVMIGFIIIGIIIGGVVLLMSSKETAFVKNQYFLNKLTTWSFDDKTTRERLIFWDIAKKGFFEKPFTGWGRENYQYVYEKYYDPKIFESLANTTHWSDRSHNIVLDSLVSVGFVGWIATISLCVIFLVSVWRSNRSFFPYIVIFFMIYTVQGFFTFHTRALYLPLFLVLSILALFPHRLLQSKTTPPYRMKIFGSLGIILLLVGTQYFTITPALANGAANRAIYLIPRDFQKFQNEIKTLDLLFNDRHPYKHELFITLANNVHNFSLEKPQDIRFLDFAVLMISEMDRVSKINPDIHPKFLAYLGILSNDILSKTGAEDAKRMSENIWSSLISQSQKRQLFYFLGAQAYAYAQEKEKALELLDKLLKIAPSNENEIKRFQGLIKE